MNIQKYICLVILPAIILCQAGCSEKSSVTASKAFTDLSVLVTNEQGDPVQGVVITTNQTSNADTTGSDGTAVIENVPANLIKITGKKQGYPDFSRYVRLESDTAENIHFIIHSEIIIHIKDDCDRAVTGAEIKTNPSTQTVVTDENGAAVLKNVPGQKYTFIVSRPNLHPVNRSITFNDSIYREIELYIESEKPIIRITKPGDNMILGAYNIIFQGTGNDYEDGELPDSLLIWHSDIDGELGTGKSLAIDKLSTGNHKITLVGTDSDSKKDMAEINISIMDYNPDSFFPLLEDSSWEYRHLEPAFIVINSNNVSEYWKIKNLTITIDDKNKRISTVYYDRSIGILVKHTKYIITDYLETEGDNVYVTRTTEEMQEWEKPEDEDRPNSIIRVETTYSPHFAILNNISNMSMNSTYENKVRIETEWYYIYYGKTSSYFHESSTITTKTEVGDMNYVQTDKGLLDAVEVTITQESTIKKWWLTSGLGIVRLDYYIFDVEQTAVLAESDMFEYYRHNNPSKAAGTSLHYNTGSPPKIFRLSAHKDKAMMELRNILKGMLPL